MDILPKEELLRKIERLEAGQALLQQEITKLRISSAGVSSCSSCKRSQSTSPRRSKLLTQRRRGGAFDSAVWDKSSLPYRNSSPLQKESHSHEIVENEGLGSSSVNFTKRQYLNILQSLGQSVYIFDLRGLIIYWNKMAEELYGFTAEEALGYDAIDLLTDTQDARIARNIVDHVMFGESWSGLFPVRNNKGERFLVSMTNTPFYDEDDTLIGIICVSSDSRDFDKLKVPSGGTHHVTASDPGFTLARSESISKFGFDSHQPLKISIASKISNLAPMVTIKVRSKKEKKEGEECKGGERLHLSDHGYSDATLSDYREDATSSGASTPRGDLPPSPIVVFYQEGSEENVMRKFWRDPGDESEGNHIHKIVTSSKAETWICKKQFSWPWKSNDCNGPDIKMAAQSDQENDIVPRRMSNCATKIKEQNKRCGKTSNNEVSSSWSSSFNFYSTSSVSSYGSTCSGVENKADADIDCHDCEVSWDDLIIGEQIGQGSCGTVYHALWYGSDVAVKVFSNKDYSDDVMVPFKQEVSLMKRLRHPNVLLLMGVISSPLRLCIVTEFLPRGSLFRLLRRSASKLDWRRRIHIALDIARGMNYLHHCHPPIVHRDLKSSNLLVDRNWNVKVADFGLSRIKYDKYLTTKTGRGTPQWMAPEVVRNEPSDEKSDVYSYGVILWELATDKIPWDDVSSVQVVSAVGIMNQRLEIPEEVDQGWASIIQSCWHSETEKRPTFEELLETMRNVQRRHTQKLSASRLAATSPKPTRSDFHGVTQ